MQYYRDHYNFIYFLGSPKAVAPFYSGPVLSYKNPVGENICVAFYLDRRSNWLGREHLENCSTNNIYKNGVPLCKTCNLKLKCLSGKVCKINSFFTTKSKFLSSLNLSVCTHVANIKEIYKNKNSPRFLNYIFSEEKLNKLQNKILSRNHCKDCILFVNGGESNNIQNCYFDDFSKITIYDLLKLTKKVSKKSIKKILNANYKGQTYFKNFFTEKIKLVTLKNNLLEANDTKGLIEKVAKNYSSKFSSNYNNRLLVALLQIFSDKGENRIRVTPDSVNVYGYCDEENPKLTVKIIDKKIKFTHNDLYKDLCNNIDMPAKLKIISEEEEDGE